MRIRRSTQQNLLPLSAIISAALLLNACANMQSVESMYGSPTVPTTNITAQNASQHASLTAVYEKYEGVPYVYGGTDARGFDCSGFIQTAMSEAANKSVPRTTESIARGGQPVRRDQLAVGDIVVFQTSAKQLHAGIYMGSGNFIHASTSKGVIMSSLENQYWKQRYLSARRYL